jgi:uncharacterized protein (TIGR03000 family)
MCSYQVNRLVCAVLAVLLFQATGIVVAQSAGGMPQAPANTTTTQSPLSDLPSTAQRLQRAHIVLIADTIASGVRRDRDRIAPILSDGLNKEDLAGFHSIEGTGVTEEGIRSAISKLAIRPNDALFVYYVGHGGGDPEKSSEAENGHYFYLTSKKEQFYRRDLLAAMKSTGARLTVLISDSCFNFEGGTSQGPPATETRSAPRRNSKLFELLLRYEGTIDINATTAPDVALSDTFTPAFVDILNEDVKDVSWDAVFERLQKATMQRFAELKSRYEKENKQFDWMRQDTQRPFRWGHAMARLGGSTGASPGREVSGWLRIKAPAAAAIFVDGIPDSRLRETVTRSAPVAAERKSTERLIQGPFKAPEPTGAVVYSVKANVEVDGWKASKALEKVQVKPGNVAEVDFGDLQPGTPVAVNQGDDTGTAVVTVRIPPGCQLYIDAMVSKGTSEVRSIRTPKLEEGLLYFYDLKLSKPGGENAGPVSRRVHFKAGDEVSVDLTELFGTRRSSDQPK